MSTPSTPREIPGRSAAQRRVALAQANRVRSQRAQLKAALRRGEVAIADAIADPPPCLASARVMEILRAVPGYGPAKAGRLLEHCRVSPGRTMAGLTRRQRQELIEALEK